LINKIDKILYNKKQNFIFKYNKIELLHRIIFYKFKIYIYLKKKSKKNKKYIILIDI